MTVDRPLTASIIVFGLVFIFLVMPSQVETVNFGRIVPSTLPTIALVILISASTVQLFTSKVTINVDALCCVKAALYVGIIALGVWLMGRFGFEYIAPPLALGIMLLMGERRWHWLVTGGVVIPIVVWLIVEHGLDRMLP